MENDDTARAARQNNVKPFFTIVLGLSMLAGVAWSEEPTVMRGAQLMACSTALERFRTEEVGSDLTHFTVQVIETPDSFEVVFVPDVDLPKTFNVPVELTLGGKTAYGREVHYIVSKDNYEILRTFFAR